MEVSISRWPLLKERLQRYLGSQVPLSAMGFMLPGPAELRIRLVPLGSLSLPHFRLPTENPAHRSRVVVIASVPAPDASSAETLRRHFGLTTAEVSLAFALHEGKSLAEIAQLRQISIHTVRNQDKSVLAKTSCRRQSELLLLVEAMRAPKFSAHSPFGS